LNQTESQQILVSVDASSNLTEVADTLRSVGMQVQSVLHALGVIRGTIRSDLRDALACVEGVQAITEDDDVHSLLTD
jgi:hypothetical protein